MDSAREYLAAVRTARWHEEQAETAWASARALEGDAVSLLREWAAENEMSSELLRSMGVSEDVLTRAGLLT